MSMHTLEVQVPISVGELLDKISILRIKNCKISDRNKLVNVRKELDTLERILDKNVPRLEDDAEKLFFRLGDVNNLLWDIEDRIRECEIASDFGNTFIQLARSVYRTNDERALIKRKLNQLLGSKYVEEKSYTDYPNADDSES